MSAPCPFRGCCLIILILLHSFPVQAFQNAPLRSAERSSSVPRNHQFLGSQSSRSAKEGAITTSRRVTTAVDRSSYSRVAASTSTKNEVDSPEKKELLSHSDILWELNPPPETPLWNRLVVKVAANLIRADCYLKGTDPPPVLCPKGGQAVLEAYRRGKKIARFGISTQRGPPSPLIDETVRDIYKVTPPFGGAGVAAIIYMFVEPEYRSRGLGELALEVISAVHAVQGCDFTVLVADDDGSGKLVEWYERNGFSRAPKLQEMMGSPGGQFGTTMICPTSVREGFLQDCIVKWW